MVWIESITQKDGFSASIVAMMFSNWISACTRTCEPSRPSRCARSATWAPLSSPVTYSTGIWRDRASSACSSKVDLPMPGSPPISTTPPETMPPPSTRSSSSSPVGVRATSAASICASVVTGCAAFRPRESACIRFLLAAGSARVSSRVFQALHWGHLPSHLGLTPPHSLQV